MKIEKEDVFNPLQWEFAKEHISKVGIFICFITKGYFNTLNNQKEFILAKNLKKPFIIIRYNNVIEQDFFDLWIKDCNVLGIIDNNIEEKPKSMREKDLQTNYISGEIKKITNTYDKKQKILKKNVKIIWCE